MGKSVSGAVWMDAELFSPFDFWQYWRNIEDKSCENFLNMLTEIEEQEKKDLLSGNINECKKFLATYLTSFVHGEEVAKEVSEKAASIFENKDLSKVETFKAKTEEKLFEIISAVGWTDSNATAKKLIHQGGITVNEEKILDPLYIVKNEDILCKGKKHYIKIT